MDIHKLFYYIQSPRRIRRRRYLFDRFFPKRKRKVKSYLFYVNHWVATPKKAIKGFLVQDFGELTEAVNKYKSANVKTLIVVRLFD